MPASLNASELLPAFPGAEGSGRSTPGGRGGKVCIVSTLDDRGPGSLRDAVEGMGPRTVIFGVAGIITLESPLRIEHPFITITGQTAPGDGICVRGQSSHIGTHDVVIRYIRFRRGNLTVRDDALGGNPIGNIIIDHVSASWGLDENLSLYRHMARRPDESEKKLPVENLTIQWSISSEALDLNNHAFGGTWGGKECSFHHNLFASNTGRNPSIGMGGSFDFRNNVVFNWRHRTMDGGDGSSRVNVIGNYYKPGPATESGALQYRICKVDRRTGTGDYAGVGKWFVAGNSVFGHPTITADNWSGGVQYSEARREKDVLLAAPTEQEARVFAPFSAAPITDHSAEQANELVLAHAGASLPRRDAVDLRVIESVRSGKPTFKDGIIRTPDDVGGWPEYPSAAAPADTDRDGLPDEWERMHGLDSKNPADTNADNDGDGYTNLEEFLNGTDPKRFVDYTRPENNVNLMHEASIERTMECGGSTPLLLAPLSAQTSIQSGVEPPHSNVAIRVDVSPDLGRNDVLTREWHNWLVPDGPPATTTIGGVTVTLRAAGDSGAGLAGGWWKAGIDHGATMATDGVFVKDGDRGGHLEMSIRGLAPGRHTVVIYHNSIWNDSVSPCDIWVDGVLKRRGVKHSRKVTHDQDAASAFVELDAKTGQNVVLLFKPDGSGAIDNVVINGFEIDTVDPSRKSIKPAPVHGDEHALERPALTWTAANSATAHEVYFGTDREAVARATTRSPEFKGRQATPGFQPSGLNTRDDYYWRVDEVHDGPSRDASSVTPGDVWRFRVRQLAFPEAEGYGRFAIGGRGGRVIEVTNLNDSGPGSLREAVKATGPRTVVFRVGGTIKLESKLVIRNPYITIAGQTAPGDGIAIRGFTFGCLGTHDVIIRHVRIRVGDEAHQTMDGTGFASTDHAIMDHCSVSWSIDEAVSSRGAGNITLQRSIVAEALNIADHKKYKPGTGHSFAGSISGNIGSFHHNLVAHCAGRNWSLAGGLTRGGQFAGRLDIRNNVVYNWSHRTTDGGVKALNFVNNLYIPGPASKVFHLVKPDAGSPDDPQQYFIAGNRMEGHAEHDADNWEHGVVVDPSLLQRIMLPSPFCEPHVATHATDELYENVLADVGANRPTHDAVDARVLNDVRHRTATAKGSRGGLPGIIDSQSDVGGWLELRNGTPPPDSDHDGMPDDWEKSFRLNPTDPADGPRDRENDGFTNLEEFLNGTDPTEFIDYTRPQGKQRAADPAKRFVYPDTTGRLVYDSDERGNRIVDFSHCGYRGGGVAIPDVPVRVVVGPARGDNGPRIQASIDYVASLPADRDGIRGAVLLLRGRHQVAGQLRVTTAGVVLRGQGQGTDGTALVATGTDRRTLIRVTGKPDHVPETTRAIAVADHYVPAGSRRLRLNTTDDLCVGDRVRVEHPGTAEWIAAVGMNRFPSDNGGGSWLDWRPGTMPIRWDRAIVAIDGNAITLDAPLTTALDARHGGATVTVPDYSGRLCQVGVENLRCETEFDSRNPLDEEHAWTAISFESAEDSWVRQVTAAHFAGSAVSVWETCRAITVEDCSAVQPVSEIGGYRRHTFYTAGQLTLFQRCRSEHGRHDFAVGCLAAGPNAFVQCTATAAHGASGPIGSWVSGVLFDNVTIDGGGLELTNREIEGQGVGWSAANCVIWQCTAAVIVCRRPATAQNWSIGCWGQFVGDGQWRSLNEFVKPASLYHAQLADRLGAESVANLQSRPIFADAGNAPHVERVAGSESSRPQPRSARQTSAGSRLVPRSSTTASHDVPPLQPLTVQNGWLVRAGRLVTGSRTGTVWWRGHVLPGRAGELGVGVTRFVPGRTGPGYTDDLDELTDSMLAGNQVALNHHWGLWYDRRRDDHQMVRRSDGSVWPPFYEQPWARSGQGTAWDGLSKYDLTRFNPWYFARLKEFADLCDRKGLVLFQQMYFQHNVLEAGAHWADFPWRPANCLQDTGFPEPPPYVNDKRIFMADAFYDVSHPVRRELHRAYIRKCLDTLGDNSNVVFFTGEEFTGPLAFVQFWLDTIIEWQQEIGNRVLVGLSTTKDVQDAVLADSSRGRHVSIIDIKYWWPTADGVLYDPPGGTSLAPRQQLREWKGQKSRSDAETARHIIRYRLRYPDKAVICTPNPASNGWATLAAGASLPNLPAGVDEALLDTMIRLRPIKQNEWDAENQWGLADSGRHHLIYCPGEGKVAVDLSKAEGTYIVRLFNNGSSGPDKSIVSVESGKKFELPAARSYPCIIWLTRDLAETP